MGSNKSNPKAMSAHLLEWVEVLLGPKVEHLDEVLRMGAVNMGMRFWNAVVFEHAGWRQAKADQFLHSLISNGMPPEVLDAIRAKLRKQRDAVPFDSRVIFDFDLVPGPKGQVGLRVASCELDLLAELDPEQLANLGLTKAQVRRMSKDAEARRPTQSNREASDAPSAPTANRAKTTSSRGKPKSPADADTGRTADSPGKAKSGRSERKPKPQRPSPGIASEQPVWEALYRAAAALFEQAPWDWLDDGQDFGIRLPGETVSHWCSVMGAAGEFYGVGLYRGDHGFDCLSRLRSSQDLQVGLLGYDGYLFSFANREDLTAQELAAIRASKMTFRGRGAWPRIEESRYGRLTRPIGAAIAPTATQLLEGIVACAQVLRPRAREAPDWFDGERPHFAVHGDELIETRLRPAPPAPPVFPPVDQAAINRLQLNCHRTEQTFEFDLCVLPGRVADEEGWQFPPLMSFLVDSKTGHPVPPRINTPDELYEVCAKNLLSLLESAKILPRHLHVKRAWIRTALAPTAAALGLKLSLRPHLPALDHMRDSLAGWMTNG